MGRVFQDNLHTMLGWFLSPKSQGLEQDGFHAVQMVARNIALGYERLVHESTPGQDRDVSIRALDVETYLEHDPLYLKPVVELKNFVQQEIHMHCIDFLLHGSLATLDYSRGWSDFDTYLIVKKETTLDAGSLTYLREKLLQAYHFLLAIDPLQHHGFLCCSEIDLEHYPAYYMPLEVLELSRSFTGAQCIPIQVIDTRGEETRSFFKRIQFYQQVASTSILRHHAYQGEYLLSEYRNAENGLYQFKYLLNNVAITPPYFYGALGEHMDKRLAIERIKPHLSKASLETLEKVTFVRSEWQNREAFPVQGNRIPDWVQETIGTDYFRMVYEFMKEVGYMLENLT